MNASGAIRVRGVPERRRPPDRRDRIARTAAQLFADNGYEQVSVEQIATAQNVTPRALYRHYPGKYDLLRHVIFDGLEALARCLDELDGPDEAGVRVSRAYEAMARFALERRGVCVLVVRESRHLVPADRAERDACMDRIVARLGVALLEHRPDLEPSAAGTLVWYGIAVLASTSFHRTRISRARGVRLLTNMTSSVLGHEVRPSQRVDPKESAADGELEVHHTVRASTREALLDAATVQFARHGTTAVSMVDLGAEAGVSAASIYEHFPGKTALLLAALERGIAILQVSLSDALRSTTANDDALRRALEAYVAFAVERPELMVLFQDEIVHLDVEARARLRRSQRALADEFVGLVRSERIDLTENDATFVTHAVMQLANEMARSGRGRERADVRDLLVELALSCVAAA
jgi:AcrR family transcriptional regulator